MATPEEEKPTDPQIKEEEVKKEVKAETEEAKKDADETPSDETIASVVERLTFFFSDANVRQDNFIRTLLLAPEKTVGIDQLLRFNTIKKYTTDPAVVKKAAESMSETLTVTEDGKSIARVKEFTKDLMSKNVPVTFVIGNLPMEETDGKTKYSVTVDEIKTLFEGYGPIALVKLRFGYSKHSSDDINGAAAAQQGGRRPKGPRKPIGSALVEFENVESFQKAAEETLTTKNDEVVEPKRKLKVGESELTVVSLEEYIEKSRKRKRERGNDDDEEKPADNGPTFSIDWKPGCVIKMEGLSEDCDREQILEAIAKGMDKDIDAVKEMKVYVDFSRGQKDGCIRFLEPDQVVDMFKKLESGELEIAGAKVEKATVLEGDVEKKYWEDFMAFKTKQLRQREEERKGRSSSKKKYRRH